MMDCAVKKYFMDAVNWIALCAGGFLAGCSQPPESLDTRKVPASEAATAARASAAPVSEAAVPSQSLTKVAGQATLAVQQLDLNNTLPEEAKVYVGRYLARIPCDDGFIPCKEGTAEFILNLLPDGTVHRSIIHYGKVFADKPVTEASNTTYRKDMWSLDHVNHEIIVHRTEGVIFYYHIQDKNHLVMDVARIHNDKVGANKAMFKSGYPKPAKAYVLTRAQDEKLKNKEQ